MRRLRPPQRAHDNLASEEIMFPPLTIPIAALVVLAATKDSVPRFNVEPSCRAAAQRAVPVGTIDTCIQKEQEIREQLVREWSKFPAADKATCIGLSTAGGIPTYTELITCLELARDVRALPPGDRDLDTTVGRGRR
jgi:hypothetical protein